MIKNRFLLFLLFYVFYSSYAQDIRIVVDDNRKAPDNEVFVILINNNDSLMLMPEKPEYYHLNKTSDDIKMVIKYKSSIFQLHNINPITKFVYIKYEIEAEPNCYVITEIFSDAIDTEIVGNLKNCSAITNIYLAKEFEPNIVNLPVRIRKRD